MQLTKAASDTIDQRMEATRRKLESVQRHAEHPDGKQEIVQEAIQDLIGTLDQLRRANRDLRQQTAELTAAREVLEAEGSRYRDLFDFAPEALIVTRCDGVIEEANRAAEVLLGMEPNALDGKPLVSFIEEPDHQGFTEAVQRLLRREVPKVQDWQVRVRPTVRPAFPASATINTTVDLRGRTVGLRWMIHDRSEREQNEQALVRAQQLAAVGTLAAGVAHEFNNIHTGILGYLHMVLSGERLEAQDRQHLEVVYKAATRAVSVTRNLLTFVRMRPPRKHIFSPTALIATALESVSQELEAEGIELVKVSWDSPHVSIDDGQLVQVLLNLIANARHAMLDCPARRLTIETGCRSGMVYIKVSDTGCGVPEANLSKIFLPFFSTKGEHAVPDSCFARVKGTGLGLSVCDSIVKAHGGEITVKSRVDIGSEFVVWLPMAEERPESLRVRDSDHAPRKRARVLIIDDEEMIRNLLAEQLRLVDHEVESTDDGDAALRMLDKRVFDVVVLDLQMPKMSGAEFLHNLDSSTLRNPPAILIATGRCDQPPIKNFGRLTILDTIYKPFELQTIVHAVEAGVAKRSQTQPSP